MILLASALLAAAAWWAVPPSLEPRLLGVAAAREEPARTRPGVGSWAWAAAVCAALGAVVLMPGVVGVAIAVVSLAMIPALVRRLETSGQRRDREALSRQGPVVCDLLSATLSSGAPLVVGIAAVAEAVEEPASGVLLAVRTSMELGADADSAWRPWADDDVLGPIGAAVVRSSRTGAPLASMLSRLGDDLRRERRTVVEVAARSAGVRAVLPLAACFLPAFLLLGVVPVVASLATDLLSSQ